MNVTKSNFLEVATEIERLLPDVDFVAIDEEMTGISLPGLQEFVGDAPSTRYAKMRQVASKYHVIQFGVALFSKQTDSSKFLARAYNFYVFPDAGPVNMEASSVHFNSKNGMDWNAWIREGIPYLTREAEAKLRLQLFPADAPHALSRKIELSNAADIETTSNAVASLKEWLADETRRDQKEFEIITTNAYLRRFMHETLRESFPDLIVESRPTKTRGLSTMVALRLAEAEKAERDSRIRAEKEAEFGMKVGVRRVFTSLAKSKKPIIGHACLYDLMFAYSHFEGSLPESFADFKKVVGELFPIVYDTQLLARSDLFKLKPNAAAEEKYSTETAYHEAGFDAYITGCVFAQMAKHILATPNEKTLSGRLVMFRNFFNVNLHGEDELITDGAYLHTKGLTGRNATEFTDALKSILNRVKEKRASKDVDMAGEEKTCAASDPSFQIRWIDDDSAFAIFPQHSADLVASVCQEMKAVGGPVDGLTFMAGEEWFHAEAQKTDLAEPLRKRARTSE